MKKPWKYNLDATKKSPHPLQAYSFLGYVKTTSKSYSENFLREINSFHEISHRKKEFGQEDCLYLNIFTPDVPITENQQRLPVLVWFFGTTFTLTTSRDDIFGPDRFMNTKEVVIVTANYRTGPFGFLSLGIEECPGNQVRTIK